MPPPHVMRSMLLRDPFWVAPSEVAKLTDREMWEWYVRPALDRQRRDDRAAARPDVPEGYAVDGEGRVLSSEDVLRALAGVGIARPAQVEEAIAKAAGGEP